MVRLNRLEYGSADLPPLVIAHGLFGSARNWGVIAKRLSDIRHVVSVDMRNHGDSPWDDANGYEEMAGDLAGVIGTLGGRADLLGHSMGGKAAMALALLRPDLVDRLVVADIAPVSYGHTQMPVLEAMRVTDLDGVTRRSEADPRLAAHLEDAGLRAFLLQSLVVDENGARWKLNLDTLAAEMARIMGFPDLSGVFEGPAGFVTGGTSDYVRAEHRAKIMRLFPGARHLPVPGAGHWLHADKPRDFEAAVRGFLTGV